MSVDTIANCLTIIRNGASATKLSVEVPYSRLKQTILEILKSEGFIKDFVVQEDANIKTLKIFLKYVDGESVIHEITRISKPGRRVYEGSKTIEPVIGNLGISILSTNRGLITDKEAKKLGVGGEVICSIW
jgi:small subunit ribosomal protein S8